MAMNAWCAAARVCKVWRHGSSGLAWMHDLLPQRTAAPYSACCCAASRSWCWLGGCRDAAWHRGLAWAAGGTWAAACPRHVWYAGAVALPWNQFGYSCSWCAVHWLYMAGTHTCMFCLHSVAQIMACVCPSTPPAVPSVQLTTCCVVGAVPVVVLGLGSHGDTVRQRFGRNQINCTVRAVSL
jgi:hypothetical protein